MTRGDPLVLSIIRATDKRMAHHTTLTNLQYTCIRASNCYEKRRGEIFCAIILVADARSRLVRHIPEKS